LPGGEAVGVADVVTEHVIPPIRVIVWAVQVVRDDSITDNAVLAVRVLVIAGIASVIGHAAALTV
jgi:hypothetical protein